MIQVDISNIWGEVSLPKLLAMEKEVFDAHMALSEETEGRSEYLGWMNLPVQEDTPELQRILEAAERIRAQSQICVVVGAGASCLSSRAAVELLQGPSRNVGRGRGDPQLLYTGNSLSSRHWQELERLLEGKDFTLIVISKSGTTLEPALAFRALRWLMERRYGTDEARSRIYAVTDPVEGALCRMAEEFGWERFSIPKSVSGRYSALTPVGLLPMAVAGIDIRAVLKGAFDARQEYDLRSFENPAWLYAAVRNMLYRSGKKIELFASCEPGFRSFGSWWQQLFGESEGKKGRGIFPVAGEFTADLHSLGQMLQEGERNLFETLIRFDPPENGPRVGADVHNLDGLNYLAGKELAFVEQAAFQGALEAHVDGGVPVITVDCGPLMEETVGALFYFLELSCAVSAGILGVNPFNQPGVGQYMSHMYRCLGRPGYET